MKEKESKAEDKREGKGAEKRELMRKGMAMKMRKKKSKGY